MRFMNDAHKNFFEQRKASCGNNRGKLSLVYLLGLTEETRMHWKECCECSEDEVKTIRPDCLSSSWQTTATRRVLTLAYGLWGWTFEKLFRLDGLFADHKLYPFLVQAMDIRFFPSRREGSGRPRAYDEEDAKRVLEKRAEGMSIRSIAASEKMSTFTVQRILKNT